MSQNEGRVLEFKTNSLIETFRTAIKDKSIISICVGKVDWEKRIIGYVKSITNTQVVIEAVDIFGSVIKRKNIVIDRIAIAEINDSYNKHLERLREQGQLIKKTKTYYYHNKGVGFLEKLELLRLKGNICTIFFGTEYMTGIVKKITDGFLITSGIGYSGTKEGESYCKIDKISKIRYEGPLEKKITYLYKSRIGNRWSPSN